ncbi:MAG: molybdopterin-binding protein [Deltaproteobacteria bacterium]|jgi:molybdenum cofactor synthesis domain-containing protein|nr:molybdopterin-binding protein [Deltaproteobacteria bacterium]
MANKFKSSAKIIPIDQSVGTVLAHDITEIRPGQFKGPAFKKGHIIREADVPHLKRVGKEHLYVLHLDAGEVHEDDAALRLATLLAGKGVSFDPHPSEGKIQLIASHRGLFKVDVAALTRINLVPDISCSARHTHSVVEKGDVICGVRAIPLIIDEENLQAAEKIALAVDDFFSVKPFLTPKTGIVITGNEVFSGLIDDKFAPIIRKKLKDYNCGIMGISFAPDDRQRIASEINQYLQQGAEMIVVAGGMSVDPDDITRVAIADAGAEDVVYGTPVLPGAMFLVGRFGDVPVMGLPACVLFFRTTVLDLILPRVLAGESITREDLASMAHGGMCLECEPCHFPRCSFGK